MDHRFRDPTQAGEAACDWIRARLAELRLSPPEHLAEFYSPNSIRNILGQRGIEYREELNLIPPETWIRIFPVGDELGRVKCAPSSWIMNLLPKMESFLERNPHLRRKILKLVHVESAEISHLDLGFSEPEGVEFERLLFNCLAYRINTEIDKFVKGARIALEANEGLWPGNDCVLDKTLLEKRLHYATEAERRWPELIDMRAHYDLYPESWSARIDRITRAKLAGYLEENAWAEPFLTASRTYTFVLISLFAHWLKSSADAPQKSRRTPSPAERLTLLLERSLPDAALRDQILHELTTPRNRGQKLSPLLREWLRANQEELSAGLSAGANRSHVRNHLKINWRIDLSPAVIQKHL